MVVLVLATPTLDFARFDWRASPLKSLLAPQSRSFLVYHFLGAWLRWAARAELSPRQLKEVIQVAYLNVGLVASLGAPVGDEVHR